MRWFRTCIRWSARRAPNTHRCPMCTSLCCTSRRRSRQAVRPTRPMPCSPRLSCTILAPECTGRNPSRPHRQWPRRRRFARRQSCLRRPSHRSSPPPHPSTASARRCKRCTLRMPPGRRSPRSTSRRDSEPGAGDVVDVERHRVRLGPHLEQCVAIGVGEFARVNRSRTLVFANPS